MGLDLQQVEIAPYGVPVKFLLCLALLVVLPWSLVTEVASSRHLAALVLTQESYNYVACMFSYNAGHVLSCIAFGLLSDIFGRKRVLLATVGVAAVYVPLFLTLEWAWSALQGAWGGYAMLLVVPSYLILGLLNPTFSIALASAFDVSNSHTQFLSVIIVGILGHGFASHSFYGLVHWFLDVTVGNSLGFLIPLAVTAFFVLAFVWVSVWKVIPETLNAPVPQQTSETLGEGSEMLGGGTLQEDDDPFEGAGRVKGSAKDYMRALVANLSYSYVWIAFWSLGGLMSVAAGTMSSYRRMERVFNLVMGYEYFYTFPFISGIELLVLELLFLALCLYVALKAPQKVIRFGYFRIIFIISVLFLIAAVNSTLMSMVYALIETTFVYAICRLMGIAMLQVLLPAAFLAKSAYAIVISNCGYKNEGGFLMGIFIAGHLMVSASSQVVVDFFLLKMPGDEMWPFPLAFAALSALAVGVVCLIFFAVRRNLILNVSKVMSEEQWGAPHKLHLLWWGSAAAFVAIVFALWLTLWITAVFSS